MKALKVKVEQKDSEIAKLKQDLADGVGQQNSGSSEQLDQLKQQCADYESDINTLQEEIKDLKQQLEAKQGVSPTKLTKNQAALEDETRRQAQ